MKIGVQLSVVIAVLLGLAMLLLSGWERPPISTEQRGYRGLGMMQVHNPRTAHVLEENNRAPEPLAPVEPGGPAASTVYKNLHVLNDLSVGELTRLMVAMTSWVSPKEGCAYCHAGADFASDALYTKVVARRMLEMTRHINTDWKSHVAGTGVTCFTCHRGQPVPANVWFTDPAPRHVQAYAGNRAGQNAPSPVVGLASLPNDPLTAFLDKSDNIRVASDTALPNGNPHDIKQTEATYGLMMYISQSLGVNCTYCHNSRSFMPWEASTPARATAWYGIRMTRDLNKTYLEALRDTFPPNRLGPGGDSPKVGCGTCHNGVNKPLYGVNMVQHYPELAVDKAK